MLTREQGLVVIANFIAGFILAAFVLGATLIAATGLVVVVVLAFAIWLLRVPQRPDVVYAIVGVLIGFVLPLLIPSVSLDTVGSDSLIQGIALLWAVYRA